MTGLLDRLRAGFADEPQAVQVDESTVAGLPTDDLPAALRVRPAKDNDGISSAASLLNSLHQVETSGFLGRNQSPAHSFELRYVGGTIDFQVVPGGHEWVGPVQRQLRDKYPNAQVERDVAGLLDLEGGEHVAAAELELERYTLYPIKHPDIDGFDRDPFGSITSEMVDARRDGTAGANVVVQILFRPEDRSWTEGVGGGPSLNTIAHELREPSLERRRRLFRFEKVLVEPGEAEKQAAKVVSDLRGEKPWNLNLRVLAASEDPEVAERRCQHAAQMFRNYYESSTQQTFAPNPKRGRGVTRTLRQAAGREWTDQNIVKAESEVSGVVHLPDESINTSAVDWALAKAGTGVPTGTPQFDFDAAGVPVGEATQAEREVAMLQDADPGDPYWYGWGAQRGKEAGVSEDTLATHQFVGGSTGQGKTTLLKHFWRQVAARDYGALYYDPKGMDASDFVSLVPEGREDDLVFIELGGDRDRQVGFNFLEVPVESADPDDPVYQQALESLVDDAAALLAQSGGDTDYWGPRMDRVARNMIRGMGKVGMDCTFLDMYFALLSGEQRAAYAQALSDERVEWIEEYAREHLAEMDDSDLEPLVGRLQQWVENDLMRELVSFPESTVSIEDVVSDGKLVVVRDASTSDTAGPLVATALLRRIWVAVREQEMRTNREDPPPFYCILDEFNEIVSERSNITEILSDARSFGLSITAATQDMSGQLGEDVANAIEGQMTTFLTFNPQRSGDAQVISHQHSPDIDAEDLMNLSKYRFYMRTHNERDELTDTYKVRAFPPVDEREAAEGMTRDPEETQALIAQSLERYGAKRRTSADMKADSPFYNGATPDDEPEAENVAETVIKVALDESIRRGEVSEGVPASELVDPLDEALPGTIGHESQVWGLVDAIPPSNLERIDGDDETRLRPTDQGTRSIFATGTGAGAGLRDHRLMLKEAYGPLVSLGLDVSLPEQGGEEEVDGRARLRDAVAPARDLSGHTLREARQLYDQFEDDHPLLARLTDGGDVTLEAEGSTGRSKPGQTILNLVKAHDAGERCLLLARPDDAETVWNALTDPPLVRDDDPRTFFNDSTRLRIDGDVMLRPGARSTVWYEDDGEFVLADSDGTEHARFPDADAIFEDAGRYPATSSEQDPGAEGWRHIYPPVIPERVFETVPGRDAWDIVVVPQGTDLDAAPREDLHVMVDGQPVPLGDVLDAPGGDDTQNEGAGGDISERLARLRADSDD